MIQGLLGKKIGMSRWFSPDGESYGVTLIACGPCYVLEKNDGKVKIGFETVKESKLSKPDLGFFKKHNLPALKFQKEVKWLGKDEEIPEVGQQITADIFQAGDMITVQGRSKGKGFSGVVKRWGFAGGPKTHGSRFHRVAGSIGQASTPSRVFPGMKMAGRKGYDIVTNKNLQILEVDTTENIIAVKGSVPGPNKGLLFLQRNDKNGDSKK